MLSTLLSRVVESEEMTKRVGSHARCANAKNGKGRMKVGKGKRKLWIGTGKQEKHGQVEYSDSIYRLRLPGIIKKREDERCKVSVARSPSRLPQPTQEHFQS
jgi:hypothetical protein